MCCRSPLGGARTALCRLLQEKRSAGRVYRRLKLKARRTVVVEDVGIESGHRKLRGKFLGSVWVNEIKSLAKRLCYRGHLGSARLARLGHVSLGSPDGFTVKLGHELNTITKLGNGGQYPVEIAFCRKRQTARGELGVKGGALKLLFGVRAYVRRNIQAFSGTGQTDVKYPHLLLGLLFGEAKRKCRTAGSIGSCKAGVVHQSHRNSRRSVEDKRLSQVVTVKSLAAAAKENYRKLKSLGLVYVHQSDASLTRRRERRCHARSALYYVVYIANEARKAAALRGGKAAGVLVKAAQIGADRACRSATVGRSQRHYGKGAVKTAQEGVDRHLP